MKKKLLYLTSIMLFSAASINAQTTVWDFGNGKYSLNDGAEVTGVYPQSATGPADGVTNLLGSFQGNINNNFGAISSGAANAGSWASPDNTYSTSNRFTTGFSTPAVATVPVKPVARAIYFRVSGPCTFKALVRSGGTANRGVVLSNGTSIITNLTITVNSGYATLSASLPAAGDYYLYADPTLAGGSSFFKLTVSGATVNTVDLTASLAAKSFQKELDVTVYANDSKIFLSDIKSSTKVEVYNVLGALVKSAQVEGDTSLDINSGMYIVKAKSAEGEKSVKVIVK